LKNVNDLVAEYKFCFYEEKNMRREAVEEREHLYLNYINEQLTVKHIIIAHFPRNSPWY
jgi:hypothetical protein